MSITHNLKHSVFIVDDDADDRESVRDAFLENKHQQNYIFMNNGEQLIRQLSENAGRRNPILVLLDLNMPGMNGKEVLRALKEHEDLQPIPVIILTTSCSVKDREASYKLGANCFVTKPDNYQELIEITDSIAKLWFYN